MTPYPSSDCLHGCRLRTEFWHQEKLFAVKQILLMMWTELSSYPRSTWLLEEVKKKEKQWDISTKIESCYYIFIQSLHSCSTKPQFKVSHQNLLSLISFASQQKNILKPPQNSKQSDRPSLMQLNVRNRTRPRADALHFPELDYSALIFHYIMQSFHTEKYWCCMGIFQVTFDYFNKAFSRLADLLPVSLHKRCYSARWFIQTPSSFNYLFT